MSEIPEKLFYKVGEVCKYTDTQPYVLRFWESEFPQLANKKNRTGQRVYTREDLQTVLQIKKLLYEQEYTIADARRALEATPLDGPVPAPGEIPESDTEQGELWTDVLPEDARPEGTATRDSDAERETTHVDSRPSYAETGALRARVELLEERCRETETALEAADADRRALRAKAESVANRLERLLGSLPRSKSSKDSVEQA